jgi:hypothetical protein
MNSAHRIGLHGVADLRTVDVLARLQLAARRGGLRFVVRELSDELRELIAFAGLEQALRLEPRRQPEQREERLGVEEEAELDHPPA